MKFILQLIVIAICGVIYFFFISPLGAEVAQLREEKLQYDQVLNSSKELKIKRDAANDEFTTIPQVSINKLNRLIPDEFNSVLFANELSFLASKYGMLIQDLKINESKTNTREDIINDMDIKPYQTTVVGFRVSGPYGQFVRFLDDIEKSLRIMDVDSLAIKAVGGRGIADSTFDYVLEVKTYHLR